YESSGIFLSGWGFAFLARQSNDLGWWRRITLATPPGPPNFTANGLVSLQVSVVMGKPITIPVLSLNPRGDRTTKGCTSFISRPACGLQSIQSISRRSGHQDFRAAT